MTGSVDPAGVLSTGPMTTTSTFPGAPAGMVGLASPARTPEALIGSAAADGVREAELLAVVGASPDAPELLCAAVPLPAGSGLLPPLPLEHPVAPSDIAVVMARTVSAA
jgi:hypothetical protein